MHEVVELFGQAQRDIHREFLDTRRRDGGLIHRNGRAATCKGHCQQTDGKGGACNCNQKAVVRTT